MILITYVESIFILFFLRHPPPPLVPITIGDLHSKLGDLPGRLKLNERLVLVLASLSLAAKLMVDRLQAFLSKMSYPIAQLGIRVNSVLVIGLFKLEINALNLRIKK